jgi:hypothetical protein
MPITALPALDRTAATFRADTDTFFASLIPTFSIEAEAARVEINTNTTTAVDKAADATQQVVLATEQVALATDQQVLTGLDRVQTGEDRVQTGLDRTAGGVSADAAEVSRITASKLNLGSYSAPPALDNQGDALLTGAVYFDTALVTWRVWTGTAWTVGISAVAGVSSINGEINDVLFKTVGGLSLLGTGDVPTLPAQTGNAGKTLITDGTTASWQGTSSYVTQLKFA